MADSQVPWGVNALGGTIAEASWRIKPSWYLVASDDRMIPPPAQRAMSERAGCNRDRSGGASLFGKEQHGILGACRGAHAAWRAVPWTGRPPGGGSRP